MLYVHWKGTLGKLWTRKRPGLKSSDASEVSKSNLWSEGNWLVLAEIPAFIIII
jgi:hypothetical protein